LTTILLLGILELCWAVSGEPDLDFYRVRFAERYIVEWVACPSDENPEAMCPVYSPFAWAWHVRFDPYFDSPPCGESLGSFCVYKHPTAVDLAGNESAQPMLLWPPPVIGPCPLMPGAH
jgi:hypothetical protein